MSLTWGRCLRLWVCGARPMLRSRAHVNSSPGGVAVSSVARCLRWLAILPIALLVGCVPLNPQARRHAVVPSDSTVLFTVTLSGTSAPDRQPTGLIVNVEAQHGSTIKQFAFIPNSSIPGHHTSFLVRLDLPAGRYSLTRFSATTADGAVIPQLDIAPRMAFDMRPKATDYLGHVELRNPDIEDGSAPDASRLVIADAYEEELPNFVHAWPE